MVNSDSKQSDVIHVVDVGNSSAKFGTFSALHHGSPESTESVASDAVDFALVAAAVKRYPEDTPWFLASVCRPMCTRLSNWVREQFPSALIRELQNDECPIQIDVEHPEKVGVDRLLGAVAANELRSPDRPAIVIDTGSAITVDAVSSTGVFLGGVIMAGFAMRTASLASKTDLLPLVQATGADASPTVIGRSTEDAIRSGIFWGTIGSVREIIDRMQNEIGDADVFVTGGDMVRMTDHLKEEAQFVTHLILSGIAIAARQLKDQS